MRAGLIIFFGCLAVGWLTPWWWSIAIVAFLVGLLAIKTDSKAFLIGFSSAGLSWMLVALYFDWHSSGILSARIGAMMYLPLPLAMAIATGVVAGLVAGLASSCGYQLRHLLMTAENTVEKS